MALPNENLVKDVWFAMWEVQTHARREKMPGPCRDLGKLANRCFEVWLMRPGALETFARGVLSGPTDLRATTGQLPAGLADACWRLITLLEQIRDGTILQV